MLDFIGAYDALRRVAAMSIEDLAPFDLLYVAGGGGSAASR